MGALAAAFEWFAGNIAGAMATWQLVSPVGQPARTADIKRPDHVDIHQPFPTGQWTDHYRRGAARVAVRTG